MKLIESSVEIIPQQPGLEGIYKQIELAGRTAYRSEDKITEGSAEKFVKMLETRKHGSVLEHGTVYLKLNSHGNLIIMNKAIWYQNNPYSKVRSDEEGNVYITTNYRVLYENNKLDDLQYICEPHSLHEKRISVRFICSRSIAQEITRHRVNSVTMESQRYCGYHKSKFNGEITFIIPQGVKNLRNHIANCTDSLTGESQQYLLSMDLGDAIHELCVLDRAINCWHSSLKKCESDYMFLITDQELKPEEARSILPNDCKTELVVTGFESDWYHFLELRTAQAAHPDIRILANNLKKQFNSGGLCL